MSIDIADCDLAGLIELISRRTGLPVDQLIGMALWEFVRSMDLDYAEMREGVVYRPGAAVKPGAAAPGGRS